jgi:heme-degrading monooxygenase HmoA
MFIAMNRFQVRRGQEEAFERVWKTRDTRLTEVPGFVEFHLLRGPEQDEYTLYSSHTIWASRGDFEAWTKSDAFRQAHASAGDHKNMYLDHPHFEGFDVVQNIR